MLIVGKTEGVGSRVKDDLHVLLFVHSIYCVSLAPSILMTAHTSQRIASAIQEEAFSAIYLYGPEACLQFNPILLFSILFQGKGHFIEIWII